MLLINSMWHGAYADGAHLFEVAACGVFVGGFLEAVVRRRNERNGGVIGRRTVEAAVRRWNERNGGVIGRSTAQV